MLYKLIIILHILVVDCGTLTDPGNGTVTFTTTTFGSTATYHCDTGYTLNGGMNTTCLSDGTWSESAPTCARKGRIAVEKK